MVRPWLPPFGLAVWGAQCTDGAIRSAEGRFALQVCLDCNAVIYPPRDACPNCLSARLPFRDVANGGMLVAETTVQTSTDPYFRERTPWRVGTVKLDVGPVVVAHLHGDTVEGARVRQAVV